MDFLKVTIKVQKHIDKSLYVVYNIEKHQCEVSR